MRPNSRWSRLPWGTLVNMLTVSIGSLIGLQLQKVFPPNIEAIVFQAIGLGTLVLGIIMSLKVPEGYLLNFIFSLILGGVIGELIGLQVALHNLGDWLQASLGLTGGQFTEGLVTAFILFCIGSMTLVGAIEEGLKGKRDLLYIKSTLDGISSIAFASTYGIGVWFSIFPMLLFQGGVTLLARSLQHFFTDIMIGQLSAVGGALIIGIGINLLQLGSINIENLLPALAITLVLTWGQKRFMSPMA
jgi:uncharacterized membrane protein YqgA involved in biofilm formation